MTEQAIDIALGFDANYAPHAGVVVTSIVANARGARLRFIMLHPGIDAVTRGRVEATAPGAKFVWVTVGDDDLPAYATRGHLTRAVLFRLGLEKLAPGNCKRLIFVDCDMVVLGDIRELWEIDLGGRALGAVVDCYQDAAEFAQLWGLAVDGARYFNAGLQVIDLEQVRRKRLFSAALAFVVANDEKLLFGDQDALNYVFWGRWAELDPAWNVQRYLKPREISAAGWRRSSPALIHFVGMHKPWMPDVWHPWAWLYWRYARQTPFAQEVAAANKMNFYQQMRLKLRWWLRRPSTGRAA